MAEGQHEKGTVIERKPEGTAGGLGGHIPPLYPRAECSVDEGILAPLRHQTAFAHKENKVSEVVSFSW